SSGIVQLKQPRPFSKIEMARRNQAGHGGQRQGVAIARAMHFKTKVLILDEPTNHLSVRETNKVIDFVKSLREQDMAGIFISHNLHHVFETCDRIVVMSRGQIVADRLVDDITMDEVQEIL
ncbi:ATP-binding cassette domain-containing protein, partial [Burkholderia pseudomallei]|uniref:ATP-binding cassette domain-containing protein n=1 Tax=Burkholderia pseudomallei TaxID=28450 RepID=UPI0021169D8D